MLIGYLFFHPIKIFIADGSCILAFIQPDFSKIKYFRGYCYLPIPLISFFEHLFVFGLPFNGIFCSFTNSTPTRNDGGLTMTIYKPYHVFMEEMRDIAFTVMNIRDPFTSYYFPMLLPVHGSFFRWNLFQDLDVIVVF